MNLKGHTRIELTDRRTGRTEVVEKDNLVTNAVPLIYATLGAYLDAGSLFWAGNTGGPSGTLRRLYGGLMLLDTAQGADPDTTFAKPGTRVVGSACADYVNTTTQTALGSYNANESVMDYANGVASFVYDFTTSQGNGVIASVCLTSQNGGAFGESADSASKDISVGRALYWSAPEFTTGGSNMFRGYSTNPLYARDSWGLLDADAAADELLFGRIDTAAKTLTLRRCRGNFTAVNLFDVYGANNGIKSETTVDIAAFAAVGYVDLRVDQAARKVYLVAVPSAFGEGKSCLVGEVNAEAGLVSTVTVPNNSGKTLTGSLVDAYGNKNNQRLNGYVYDGAIFFQDTEGGIYLVDLSAPTVFAAVDNPNGQTIRSICRADNGKLYSRWAGAVVDVKNRAVRSIAANTGDDQTSETAVHLLPLYTGGAAQSPLAICTRYYGTYANAPYAHPVIRSNYLATINDLPSPVEKTPDKTMKITYTLREVR